MNIDGRVVGGVVLAGMALSFFAGYKLAPREILDSEVQHVGIMTIDTKKVLSATIESLKSETKLVSYSYTGQQNVSINRSSWYLFDGNQQLIVPAVVSYFVDLSQLTESSASFDAASNSVTVLMPRLMLNVDFDPRRATTINSGMLTMSDEVVQALTKINYDSARKSATTQAQQAELVRTAKDRTRENIARLFSVPLKVSGMNGVKVIVTFPGESEAA